MSAAKNGIVQVVSMLPFDETLERLESLVSSRGLTVFARIDFGGDAARVGLVMRPTRLLIFGNPKGGTQLMVAAPTLAIDLPLKVLVSEDGNGRVLVSYNSPQYLQNRHGIPEDLLKNIAGIVGIVDSAVRERRLRPRGVTVPKERIEGRRPPGSQSAGR